MHKMVVSENEVGDKNEPRWVAYIIPKTAYEAPVVPGYIVEYFHNSISLDQKLDDIQSASSKRNIINSLIWIWSKSWMQ